MTWIAIFSLLFPSFRIFELIRNFFALGIDWNRTVHSPSKALSFIWWLHNKFQLKSIHIKYNNKIWRSHRFHLFNVPWWLCDCSIIRALFFLQFYVQHSWMNDWNDIIVILSRDNLCPPTVITFPIASISIVSLLRLHTQTGTTFVQYFDPDAPIHL